MGNHEYCTECGASDFHLGRPCNPALKAKHQAEEMEGGRRIEQLRLRRLASISILKEIREREICWYPAHREIEEAFNDMEKQAIDDAIEALEWRLRYG